MRVRKILLSSAVLFFAAFSSAWSADEPSLWQIQQILAHKQYVDLTHEFAPGIPHWPGFPDEARKTIYWYEKRPDVMGQVSSPNCIRMSANGARTWIPLLIS